MISQGIIGIGPKGLQRSLFALLLAAAAATAGCHQTSGHKEVARAGPADAEEIVVDETPVEAPSELLVREAQFLLTELGFVPGPIDGQAGPLTLAAVSDFQEQAGLAVDGRITQPLVGQLWARVDQAATREVQERLTALGYDPGAHDGMASLETVVAVTQFQKDRGFMADGEIDWNLLQRLRAAEVVELAPQQTPEGESQDGGEAPKPAAPDSQEVRTADGLAGENGAHSPEDDLSLFAALSEREPVDIRVAPGDTLLVYVSAWESGPERVQVDPNGLLVLRGGVSLKTAERNLQDLEDALMSKLLEQRITELSEAGGDEESITEEASQFLLDLQVRLTKEAAS